MNSSINESDPFPFGNPNCEGCREGYANQQGHTCLEPEDEDMSDVEDEFKVSPNSCPGDGSCLSLCDRTGEHSRCEVLVGNVNDPMSCYCNTFTGCMSTSCNLVPCKKCGTGHPKWFITINDGMCTICDVENSFKKQRK